MKYTIPTNIISKDGLGRRGASYVDLKRNVLVHQHPDGHYLDSRAVAEKEVPVIYALLKARVDFLEANNELLRASVAILEAQLANED